MHGYIDADLRMKERALDKLTRPRRSSRFQPGDELLRFSRAFATLSRLAVADWIARRDDTGKQQNHDRAKPQSEPRLKLLLDENLSPRL